MVNAVKLLLLSGTPLLWGYVWHRAMWSYHLYGVSLGLLSAVFYLYWCGVGYLAARWIRSPLPALVIGNVFGALILVLNLYQALVLERYLSNDVGTWSQLFYLPALRLAVVLQDVLMLFVQTTRHTWLTFTLSFLLMLAVYYAGFKKGQRDRSKKENPFVS